MPSTMTDQEVSTLEVRQEIGVKAPIQTVFEAVLEELGPGSQMPDGKPFPMKIEPWPGGRWFRDLGTNTGHLWGHVQVIKPPTLLELCGPMFMSYPAVSHVQYRLTPEGEGTRVKIVHKALGLIPPEHREGVDKGWEHGLTRIRDLAERKLGAGRGR
jgi:uncharacterized protein YndB with AHSA1/START domain